ncbi:MAG TPA: ATP-binding protein, partial [Vicinamibacterales bacterium]|nr:ATP-binding protein [Vicinamibacterales bacterium]
MAKWLPGLSLRARLAVLVALGVAGVIAFLSFLQVRLVERTVEKQLVDSARATALAVANGMGSLDEADVPGWLHDFITADPAVRAITLVEVDNGEPSIFASTSSQERSEAIDLAADATKAGEFRVVQTDALVTAAMRVRNVGRKLGVVVTVSMGAADQVRTQARTPLWFAAPTVLLLTLLVDWLARRLIHRRVAVLVSTMHEVASGNLTARAPVERADELGSVAARLNEMLERMEHFNVELQQRIESATGELRERNVELEESYRRVLVLRDALARAERMAAVGQMAANVAHQIGTPLNLISGYVQMVREGNADPRTRERLEIVERQIQQVTRVLRSMLDHARQRSPREVVDLGHIIEYACETAQSQLSYAGIRLNLQIGSDLPRIEADATELELVVLNLIKNSMDAMPYGGTLTIAASATETGVRMDVADTGTGIPPEMLARVFEPWVTTKTVGQGTGLGLAIAREVIEAHGGTIAIRNVEPGGAVVTIDLPRVAV